NTIHVHSKYPLYYTDSRKVSSVNGLYTIIIEEEIITAVTATDALWADTIPEELAQNQVKTIKEVIVQHRQQNSLKNNLFRVAILLVIIGLVALVIWGINRIFRLLNNILLTNKYRFLSEIKIRNYELVKKDHIMLFFSKILSVIKIIFFLILFLTVIPLAFSV